MAKGLKVVACLKAFRGSVALAFGASFFIPSTKSTLILQGNIATVELKSLPLFKALIDWISSFSAQQIVSISLLALILGTVRWIEAVGIWNNKNWAEWLAVVTGGIYIAFEVNELLRKFSWLMLVILVANLVIVTYLLYVLDAKRRAKVLIY